MELKPTHSEVSIRAWVSPPVPKTDLENSNTKSSESSACTDSGSSSAPNLPDYDRSPATFWYCLAGTIVSLLLSAACIIYASLTFQRTGKFFVESTSNLSYEYEYISLGINFLVAFSTDGMGFAHATSLRWGLYKDGKLEFNTNLRLFRSASSLPNRWYMNLISAVSLVACYTGTSILFVRYERNRNITYLNPAGLIVLGIGLAGKAVIAGLCLYGAKRHGDILTWSSNPLNNALACAQEGFFRRREGRCMLSVHQKEIQSGLIRPLRRQGNAWSAARPIKFVVLGTWILTILAVIWCIAIMMLARSSSDSVAHFSWREEPDNIYIRPYVFYYTDIFFEKDANGTPDFHTFPGYSKLILSALFAFLVQGLQTLGLHCTELVVNFSRDEAIWTSAYSHSGTELSPNPLVAAVKNYKFLILTILKAVLHWLLSQCMRPHVRLADDVGLAGVGFRMFYGRLGVYAIAVGVTAGFTTILACLRRRGVMPATWGDLQVLTDLVDCWETDERGKLWWGDKGMLEGGNGIIIRHAGTAPNELREVRPEELYAGGCRRRSDGSCSGLDRRYRFEFR